MNINEVGARWFKCDLHLHTTASLCFKNKEVTAKEWVAECLNKGLHCVAVTDHNTNLGIAEVQKEAIAQGLYLFPGVEITCDTAKVHLLVLFDVDKNEEDVRDFLVRCDIKRDVFGQQKAFTKKSIFKVSNIAYEFGALVIPAHIDEFNGLGNIGNAQLKEFYNTLNINAVQVVHEKFYNNQKDDIEEYLSDYYSKSISNTQAKEWFAPVRIALEHGLAITTFSDNPHEPKNPQHGLWGVGYRYTWIKMDATPSLEGLRQAFLIPEFRIKNDFELSVDSNPNKKPDLMIKSLSIHNTTINKENEEFKIPFHHQLNTIIGGPGSGKSSILKCIRGILKNTNELDELRSISEDHNEFYKKVDKKSGKGVFTSGTVLSLRILRNNVEYEIVANKIEDTSTQDIKIYKIVGESREIQPQEILKFFKTEHYSQKHIFEIAQEPNSLRDRIDRAINGLEEKKHELHLLESKFLTQSSNIRDVYSHINQKKNLIAAIQDIDNQISALKASGIEEVLKEKEHYEDQNERLDEFFQIILRRMKLFDNVIDKINADNIIDLKNFKKKDALEIGGHIDVLNSQFSEANKKLKQMKNDLGESFKKIKRDIKNSSWYLCYEANDEDLKKKKQSLKSEGFEEMTQFDDLVRQKAKKESDLREITRKEKQIEALKTQKANTQRECFEKAIEISNMRKRFIQSILKSKNVKINIRRFRDKRSFEKQIRKIIQRETGFEKDLELLIDNCFDGNIEDKLQEFRGKVRQLRQQDKVEGVTKYLNNLFGKLDNTQIDKLQILVPEDEITIEYKPKNSKHFIPLSNASAGQKATAILTFILSFGDYPLILDQPEDDLNGKLVYELIVDRLKEAKNNRQMIIVTHDANIPVNADSELITCLNSNSSKLEIIRQGTVEQSEIKREICDVMEGSVEAFDMRAKRYKLNG